MKLINTAYSFACAYLKGEEARCLTSDHVEGLSQRASTIRDSLEVIRNTDLGEYLADMSINTIGELDERLWDYLRLCGERLEKFRLPRDLSRLLELYLRKFDLMNVKVALRKVVGREQLPAVPIGVVYELGYSDELMLAETIRDITEVLIKADLIDYIDILEGIKDIDRRSLIEGETRLDNRYFSQLRQAVAGMTDGGALTMALTVMIDSTNLGLIFRTAIAESGEFSGDFFLEGGYVFSETVLREMASMKPLEIIARLEGTDYELAAQDIVKLYEKSGMIDSVDRIVEKQKFRLLRDLLSPRALSPCNLLWYLYLKELEIRNLRLLLKTGFDGLATAEIRDYLVTVS
ncbi:MAG: hypothetical protein AVO39_11195 [delta proteobacterium MLS_D]|nr:MAG: hypothetical protein AVO39_11195 [delta proteobacterium MLS_D]